MALQKQLKEEKEVEEVEEEYNETIVTLRLPKKYYKTGYAVAHLLGFKSFDEYVSDAVLEDIEMEIDGRGSLFDLDKDEDLKNQLLNEKWEQTDGAADSLRWTALKQINCWGKVCSIDRYFQIIPLFLLPYNSVALTKPIFIQKT